MPPSAPSPFPWIDVIVILLLIALNGVFAMAELAIVSSRRPRLRALAKAGRRGAQTAIDLAAEPGRFLSTVQIGITLIGILAGAYSGASLGGPVGERIALLGVDPKTAGTIGFGVVILITTYASLVIGELVPKQFALRAPESIAAFMAVPMLWIARITAPLVWLLDRTSALIFRLLRLRREESNQVTAEELQIVVAEAHSAGVLEEYERALISGVVRLADRPTREVMTPRTDVDWIDVDSSTEELREALRTTQHSRLPIAEGSVDRLLGVVQARDIVAAFIEDRALDLRALVREAPVVADQMDAMDTLAVLRDAEVPMAFVHDEYGHFEGVVTPADLLSALAGVFASNFDSAGEAPLVEREDGSWWVSGSLPADAMSDRLGINLPEDRDYATAAGFALSVLKHIPEVGERFSFGGWRFEIVDMDGFKIDKLLASEVVRGRRG
ncbi:hemolysin family protein [Sphingosinicella sp. BN140058]|uniref:hemolysin family protein n=1 Tax=Sphingosinicella sp. BN140058 TaxID=1892855 RepID=UPI00101017FD|nr:hemolysin family protein [Sphingosinicella sp. BN140058]QAY77087.1 HlyC/CorC family transporter [Sphingosinicella sp. BN140058]